MTEHLWIERYFKPLAAGFDGSLGLLDDGAWLPPSPQGMVMTTDTMVETIHFLGNEAPHRLAKKLLRINLSDLAAMGARPLAYSLNLSLPPRIDESWIRDFAEGLAEDQRHYGIQLAGGDTTTSPQHITLTITAYGVPLAGGIKRRNAAKAGDIIYVTGTIGDAALGLRLLTQRLKHWQASQCLGLCERYELPTPRLAFAEAASRLYRASTDISDGLMADLRRICRASQMGAEVHRHLIPLHHEAAMIVTTDASEWLNIVAGGDDYELLITAPPEQSEMLKLAAQQSETPLTPIGRITANAGQCLLLDDRGIPIGLAKEGYEHFTDRNV